MLVQFTASSAGFDDSHLIEQYNAVLAPCDCMNRDYQRKENNYVVGIGCGASTGV